MLRVCFHVRAGFIQPPQAHLLPTDVVSAVGEQDALQRCGFAQIPADVEDVYGASQKGRGV